MQLVEMKNWIDGSERSITIPKVLYVLGEMLKQNNCENLKKEKIFRLNGDLSKIQLMRIYLAMGDYLILEREFSDKFIEWAVFFKEIIISLEEPVIPFDLWDCWVSDERYHPNENEDNFDAIMQKVCDLLGKLP